MSELHPESYAAVMAKAEEYTAGLRYLRTLPASAKRPGAERVIERYIMLLRAKARGLFPAEMRRYLTPEGEEGGRS
jgi:hypothetical protein